MDAAAQIFHDRLEDTKLAQALANGTVTREQYRVYLRSMLEIFKALEQRYPECEELGVRTRLEQDLALTGPTPYEDESVPWAAVLQARNADKHDLFVLGLGLCYGGKLMAKRTQEKAGLPVRHFRMPKGSIEMLRKIETTSSGLCSAFHKTLAWYHNVA